MRNLMREIGRSVSAYFHSLDKLLLLLTLLLSAFGMVMIHTATATDDIHDRCITVQGVAIVIGFIALIVLSKVKYEFIARFSPAIIIVASLILTVTIFLADEDYGNRSWLNFGPVNLQPAELMKLALILTLSWHLSLVRENMNRLKNLGLLLLHFAAYLFPVILQEELGSALVYIFIFVIMMFLAGLKYRYIIIAAVLTVGSAPILWNLLQDYHKERILFSLMPEMDPLGAGWQPLLSRMALGSGQLHGLGYGQGIQTQNKILPARHTDLIFSVVGEEFGFLGCVCLIAAFLLLLLLIVRNARTAKDFSGRMICIGVAVMLASQMCINIGMCIGVSPVIGITLPLISYGGSSVLSTFLAVGLVESVHMKPDLSLSFAEKRRCDRRRRDW